MNEFRFTSFAQEVIFGPGTLDGLSETIERCGWPRLMLCSSGSLQRDGSIAAIQSALGERLVAVYDRTQPHVPESQVEEVVALARRSDVSALIGLGGGSPLGLAKAASFALEERRGSKHLSPDTLIAWPRVPVIAIPTTYAGSEMTPVFGVTRQVDGVARKVTVTDASITPKLVIYDPRLTLGLPAPLTASTGINALAHCIEALYSLTRNPLSSAAATGGIRAIMRALPRCYAEGRDLEARTEMLMGAFLAGSALAHVTMALHHGLCHVLGGTAGVPHGIVNSIILPHAMRFNLDATAPQLVQAAEAMGIAREGRSAEQAVEEAIQRIYDLVGSMNLPQRLRDVGVRVEDLPHLAQLAFQSRTVQSNPKPVTSAAQIEELLRAAW